MQGMLARAFKCGSLVFITATGLEVGYAVAGAGAGRTIGAGGGIAIPKIVKRPSNMFLGYTRSL